ncbi:MAG: hypothetical protein WA057_06045, partial [Candidatus Magasanikiibacteriota bacterium]
MDDLGQPTAEGVISSGVQPESLKVVELGQEKSRTGKKKPNHELWNLEEVDGVFEVNLPGFVSKKLEAIFGTTKERFTTRSEAEKAVEDARAR